MQIRIASLEDLEFIEGAYEHARAFMQANGNATQWTDGYPGRIGAEEDIARKHCFLVADDEGPDADYHVIHRVAAVRGRGIARTIFSFAAEDSDYLRCDTHEENIPMRRALESFGFRECGTITVANGTQRVAYD